MFIYTHAHTHGEVDLLLLDNPEGVQKPAACVKEAAME